MPIPVQPYDPYTDPVIQALIAEAEADPDVVGLALQGSRALGAVTPESDYDVVFIVRDEAATRYDAAQSWPTRAQVLSRTIDTADMWSESIGSLRPETVSHWDLPIWADALVLYDRTGEVTPAVDALRSMPEEQARASVGEHYDGYLNQLYRSLKCWRRGNELGGRLEASTTITPLLNTLFALERRWCPFLSRLHHHLHRLQGQGWQPGELEAILLDIAATGDPRRQQELARRVVALLRARGHHNVYEEWGAKIDTALSWTFDSAAEAEPAR